MSSSYFTSENQGLQPRPPGEPPFARPSPSGSDAGMTGDPQFDIFEWHPAYQSCQRYFLDHAQHDGSVQAVAALVNIALPFQWAQSPISNSSASPMPGANLAPYQQHYQRPGPSQGTQRPGAGLAWVSLVPYIRRLIVTGFDSAGVLHGFFGDEWKKGIGPVQECERRNYLFAAKSVGWAKVKCQYDMSPHESVPFLKPLQNVQLAEIEGAEKTWSQWLAMEDWMVGPRAPVAMDEGGPSRPRPSQEL
ncbi:hypothetical protein EJ05DRAFT_305929 [Pseudovirgaria hyperparasitica]|uniref:Ilp is an apoptosis inhibitor n=1 Tax=Pseudovirgaria hyperparasitica TaxID=470096 RepID=A0A6A6W9Z6_9PEZI|nr:uncharacterized protein EJ05DRAFT_305929 [Pseudovirgaria hyperparasitica]KAF2759672.1 hypothetical protein EJ05DRAFT_305929 [Pseudovirgaria hyperparasitica]